MKNIKLGLLVIAALLFITGCSEQKLDLTKTSETIMNTIEFDDELVKLSDNVVKDQYELPETGIEEYVIYVSGTRATANEFAIFKVADENAANAVKTALATRVATQIANYENYVPGELNRINNKLIVHKGNYILFAVTNSNEDIQDIFNNALK